MIFLLLRVAFWMGVVLVLLPTFAGGDGEKPSAAQAQLNAGDAVIAASATVSDLVNFCERQPGACTVGAQAAAVVGEKAQAGAKILYDYLNDRSNPKTGSVTTAPETVKVVPVRKTTEAGRDTLKPSDRTPAWRGPSAPKDNQGKRAG